MALTGVDPIASEEVFRLIIEEKATKCLVLKNIVSLSENVDAEDYKELEFDVQDEMVRYGKVVRCHVPRPPKYGDPFLQKGFGKVYVKFETAEMAERAKKALFKRRFNDRSVEVHYYSDEKFSNNIFD